MSGSFIIIHNAIRRREEMEEEERQERKKKEKYEAEMKAKGYKKETYLVENYYHYYRNKKKADIGFKFLILQSLLIILGAVIPSIVWYTNGAAIICIIIAVNKIFNTEYHFSIKKHPDPRPFCDWLRTEDKSFYSERWVKK